MKRSSLSVQLLAWTLPVSLGALFLTTATTYYVARQQILQGVQKEVDALAQNVAEQIRGFFIQRRNDLATIGQSPLFKDYHKNSEYNLREEATEYRREIEKMLLDFSLRTQVYPQLRYLDARGREVSRILDGRIVKPSQSSEQTRSLFAGLKQFKSGQHYISDLTHAPWHPYPIVEYAMPLSDDSGRFYGALIFDCSLSTVHQLLKRSHLGIPGDSTLVNRATRAEIFPLPPPDRGTLTTFIPVSETPWAVYMTVDRDKFLIGLTIIRTIAIICSLCLAALMIFIVTTRIRKTTQPIQQLADVTRMYAQGNLSARTQIAQPQEVALLASAFNTMADRLQQRTGDLIQRVKELTSLQQMNEAVLRLLGRREIGRACLETVLTGLNFDWGALYWVDADREEIVGEYCFGNPLAALTNANIRRYRTPTTSDDILAHVARSREVIYVEDATKDPRCSSDRFPERKSFCLAPILGHNNRVIGIIEAVQHIPPGPLVNEKLRRLALFCGVAGLALENAQLLENIVQSEARYRTALENSPDAVVALDQHMRITLWNRRAETLFGYLPIEARGRTLDFVVDPKDYQTLLRQIDIAGTVRHAEVSGNTRDGRHLDLNISWTGQYADRGAAHEWFVVIQDVTEKKNLQAQLIQAEKMSAVGALIAGVAHELNNPLAAVMGFSEILRDNPQASPEEKEDLRLLRSSAIRCRDIVQGLLAFVRQQSSARHRVSLNRVVQETLALLEYRLVKTETLQLEVDLSAEEPVMAGDFFRIQQILVNLINNACDALSGQESKGIIRIRTKKHQQQVQVEVEDNGPGIPAPIRERIFDPFFTTKTPGKGTGLGLSISSQIAAEFDGTLRYEESREKGARFVACFPTCPREISDACIQTQLPPQCPKRRVLVVDDEPDITQLIMRILKEDGVEAIAATGFQEASKQLANGKFDLIIADVGLGQSRGTDLVQIARRLEAPPLFLFVSGDVLNTALIQQLNDLKVPLLAKPFLRTEFLRTVRKILSKSRTPLRH